MRLERPRAYQVPYCLLAGDFVSTLRTADLPEAGFLQLAVDRQTPAARASSNPAVGPLEDGHRTAGSFDRCLRALRERVGTDRELGRGLAVAQDLDRELESTDHAALKERLRRDVA